MRVLAVAAHVAVLAIEAGDGDLARRAVAADGRPDFWSSLAHGLLCLNHGIRGFIGKDTATPPRRNGSDAGRWTSHPSR